MSGKVFIHPWPDPGQISAHRFHTAGKGFRQNQRKALVEGGEHENIGAVHQLRKLRLGQPSGKPDRTGASKLWGCQVQDFFVFLLVSMASGQSEGEPFRKRGRQQPERAKKAHHTFFFRNLSGK